MSKYIYVCIILILLLSLLYTAKQKKAIESKWKDAVENVKSYSHQFSDSGDKDGAFKLTTEQLGSSRDSIFQELEKAKRELKVKDSKLKSLMYVSSSFGKSDTVTVTDTLLRGPQVNVDTLLRDEWYSVMVKLEYPSTIIVKPEYKSVKDVVVSSKRETINPPRKFFLLRWFQRKHTVLNIDVIERNPYVQNQNSRYVEIIK